MGNKRIEGSCKVKGCSTPIYAKRFCERHYGQYLHGIINESGIQIIEPHKTPTRPLNVSIRFTLKLIRRAKVNMSKIDTYVEQGDPYLNSEVNKRLKGINENTASQETRLTESEFVFKNIHLLQPQTITDIIGGAPAKKVRKLSDHDIARIAWHLLRHKTTEEVSSMFSFYSLKQIKLVEKQIQGGKLPISPKLLKERKT